VSAAGDLAASGLIGHWQGQWVREGSALQVWVDFTRSDSGYAGSFGSEALRVLDIPFRSVQSDTSGVRWLLVGDATTSRFSGRLAGDRLSGGFEDGASSGSFELLRTHQSSAPPYATEEVRFRHGEVTLAGSLLMPATRGPHPALVFVHGSGPEARYAERFLADRFARAGFAALIYDKRGVGASTGDWQRADFDALAGDGVEALRMLSRDPRVRTDAIGLYGHSQGGTLAPLIASRWPDIAFVIASAGGGVPPPEAERYSYRNYLGVARLHGTDSLRALAYIDAIVRIAYGGEPWTRADSAARANSREKWFSDIPDSTNVFWWLAPRTAGYNPVGYWRRVKAPVLLIYGERDERVPVESSLRNIRAALRAAGNTRVTVRVFSNCDHTFRITESAGGKFQWPRTPEGYLETLIGWASSMIPAR
jgi:pimeloyl-ACP methyl ester carboxylesterase